MITTAGRRPFHDLEGLENFSVLCGTCWDVIGHGYDVPTLMNRNDAVRADAADAGCFAAGGGINEDASFREMGTHMALEAI